VCRQPTRRRTPPHIEPRPPRRVRTQGPPPPVACPRGTIGLPGKERTITEERPVESLPPAAADDTATVARLTGLINEVYAVAEEGLWATGAKRTNPDEVAGFVRAGQLAVARRGGRLVGCVRIHEVNDTTSEFGMLAADPAHRGLGVGRDLVRFAEHSVQNAGHDTMRLELLVPREWSHPSKEFLAGWYGRLGYTVTGAGAVEESHPGLAPLLATTCDFVIYEKALRS
jgi:GNAT superfamily N-acetyltransferase